MSQLITFVVEFLEIPEFIKTVGWMFAVAMFLGGVVIKRRKSFLVWTGVTVVFLIFQEWLRYIWFANTPSAGTYTGRPAVFTFMAAVIFFLGIIAGISIVYITAKQGKRDLENEMEKLKGNGFGDIVEIAKAQTAKNGNGQNGGKVNHIRSEV